jgi:predicted nucleic acid-binding protein
LVLIEQSELLPKLYGQILIPDVVAWELNHSATPDVVRRWIRTPPDWLKIVPVTTDAHPISSELDVGERAALALALSVESQLVIMDDREGVEEARRLNLEVTGTLGVLDQAAAGGFVNLGEAFEKLLRTNFRAPAGIMQQLLADHRKRL